jgi:maleate isomerase
MKLAFDIDRGQGGVAALGVIVLQSDETLENEWRHLFADPGVALHHARIPSGLHVTTETLKQMEQELATTAALLPGTIAFDAIAYACTSGASIIGPDVVAEKIHQYHAGVPVSDPISAVMAGCRALGVRRLGFLTPYVPEVSQAIRTVLETNEFEIAAFGSFEESEEHVVARIAESSTLDAMVDIGKAADCDAVFASCTNLRTFDVLAEAEERLGKPVISSNQALAWHLLRLAGVTAFTGPGRLFTV